MEVLTNKGVWDISQPGAVWGCMSNDPNAAVNVRTVMH